jgi:hypothetical protein
MSLAAQALRRAADVSASIRRVRKLGRSMVGLSRLGWSDRLEVAHVFFLALLVHGGLKLLSLPRLAALLGVDLDFQTVEPREFLPDSVPGWAARRMALAKTVLAHSPGGATCLRTTLVCAVRLRQLGPMVRIGVARQSGGLQAHAWLEIGSYCLDPAAAHFGPISYAAR